MLAPANQAQTDGFYSRHECKMCGLVEIPPDAPADERQRRGDAAQRAHHLRLAESGRQARANKAAAQRARDTHADAL
jgi:hypothetical protein